MSEKPSGLVKQIRKTPDAIIVDLAGEVDLHHSPALHAALVDLANERPKRLIINLSEVPYIDSSGIGTFVEVFRRISANKGKMIFFGLSSRVRSVFEITKLDKFFTLSENEDQAVKV